MRFSIVTPVYNSIHYIEETIKSVLDQQGVEVEYMVLDGGSTDGTVEVIERYVDQLAYFRTGKDAGQTAAINEGFARATGDVVAYINGDDYYLPGAFVTAMNAFLQNPGVGAIYGDCFWVSPQGLIYGKYPARAYTYRRIFRGNLIPQQSCFVRREVFQELGPLVQNLHYCMDLEWWLRIGRSYPMLYLPLPLAAFRIHGSAKSAQVVDHHREAVKVLRTYDTACTCDYWIRMIALERLHEKYPHLLNCPKNLFPHYGWDGLRWLIRTYREELGRIPISALKEMGRLLFRIFLIAAGRALRKCGQERVIRFFRWFQNFSWFRYIEQN